MSATDYFDQALQAISAEIQNRQIKVSALNSQMNSLNGEIEGLRLAQHRIEQVRAKVPKAVDPITGNAVD